MNTAVPSNPKFDVYRTVTDQIIEAIEAGAGEFVMPWHRAGPGVGRPSNALSGAPYQGVNVIALWAQAMLRGYGSGWWATYDQWKKLGAQVGKGQRSTTIVFYKPPGGLGEDDEEPSRLIARAFRVFNAEQVTGWEPPMPVLPDQVTVMEEAEAFVAGTGAHVREGGDIACYIPSEDLIRMPSRSRFLGSATSSPTEAFYSVLFHELVHWSGAGHRLGREFGKRFGDAAYAAEELTAELGAAFLCADQAVSNYPRPDHAAYLVSWLDLLGRDKRAVFTAAQKAREAVGFLKASDGST